MKKLFILNLLIFMITPFYSIGVNCDGYTAWSSGGQPSNGYRTYNGNLYRNNGSNGWDGSSHNPSVNGHWTLIGSCSAEPVVATNNKTSVTYSSMTLNGNVTNDGGYSITDRGFIYGTNQSNVNNSTISSLVGTSTLVSEGGTSTGTFNSPISNLCTGVTYYFKSYSTNSDGTGYGTIKNGTTTSGTYLSTQDGAFTSSSTWGGCTAPALNVGNTIIIAHDVTATSLSLSVGTDITVNSSGKLTTTGNFKVHGSGKSHVDGTLDVGGSLIMENNGYLDGSGIVHFVTKSINPANSGAYVGCVDGTKWDDNVYTTNWHEIENPWDLTECAVSLPVELISFGVKKKDNYIEVNWITGAEINNSHFEILVSEDGFEWESIQTVLGMGTTYDLTYYYENVQTNKTYFKLKQVDYDGTTSYSNVRYISADEQPIFNSTLNYIYISNLHGDVINFYNVEGQLVHNINYDGTSVVINKSTLNTGFYIVRIGELSKKVYIYPN